MSGSWNTFCLRVGIAVRLGLTSLVLGSLSVLGRKQWSRIVAVTRRFWRWEWVNALAATKATACIQFRQEVSGQGPLMRVIGVLLDKSWCLFILMGTTSSFMLPNNTGGIWSNIPCVCILDILLNDLSIYCGSG